MDAGPLMWPRRAPDVRCYHTMARWPIGLGDSQMPHCDQESSLRSAAWRLRCFGSICALLDKGTDPALPTRRALMSPVSRGRKSANAGCMTPDERAQLAEDIKMAGSKRRDIAERVAMDKEFDVAAAWEELDELDKSIATRVMKSRVTEFPEVKMPVPNDPIQLTGVISKTPVPTAQGDGSPNPLNKTEKPPHGDPPPDPLNKIEEPPSPPDADIPLPNPDESE